MKKIIFMIIVISSVITTLIIRCSEDDIASSDKCNNSTYTKITSAEKLQNIELDGHYCLIADINLINITNFMPIGSDTEHFNGTLDGQGNTIQNLNISTVDTGKEVGLFSHIGENGTVKNLTIENVTIRNDDEPQAALTSKNYGTIDNVHINNIDIITNFKSHPDGLGGISAGNYGSIRNSSSREGTIQQISTDNTSSTPIGGLVGLNKNGEIKNSYSETTVTRTAGNYIGGLVGNNVSDSGKALIENSYTSGNVTGKLIVGGLVGINKSLGGTANIKNSYATGDITGDIAVGGIAGLNESSSIIENSYATGSVTGSSGAGGVVGGNRGAVTHCYFDTIGTTLAIGIKEDTNNQTVIGITTSGITGGGIQPFQNASWDFSNIWKAIGNGQWPNLAWQP